MKRIISLLLIVAVALTLAVGCNQTPADQTPCKHVDDNNTGYCDICNAKMPDESGEDGTEVDGDGDGENGGGTCSVKADHKDKNSDGKCDICSVSVVVVLDIYALNDLHGKFADSENNIGVDELTTYLQKMREGDENSILLSSGDMWQGSSESNMTSGAIMVEWMNALGFASMTIGNHEYDWGPEKIKANAELANFPFLAINIFDKTTNARVEYCDASAVVQCGELTVGIIGAVGNCYSSIAASQVKDVYFKTGGELTELIKAESQRLRSEEGVDFVVLSIHDGYSNSVSSVEQMFQSTFNSYYGAELSSGGYVDMAFEGHTHASYVLIDQYGVYHLQNGGENKGISHAEISINFANDSWSVNTAQFVRSSVYGNYADSPIVSELLEKYRDVIAPAYEVLGNNAFRKDDNEIEDTVAMLYCEFGERIWGAEYDIVLGGGFLKTRSPYDLDAGEIMYSDIYSILPFDNNIVLCSIKGYKLKSRFVNPSNDYHTYISEYGNSIKNSIDDDAIYYIVTDSYTADYAANGLTVIEDFGSGTYARDLLAEYIKAGGYSK